MILLIYNSKIYKEFFLPNRIDMDYTLLLEKEIFGLCSHIRLKMETTKQGWRVFEDKGYKLWVNNEHCENCLLTSEKVIYLQTEKNEEIKIFMAEAEQALYVLKKYSLYGENEITIGKADYNKIVYDYQNFVSSHHAVIRRHSDGYYIEDLSINGIFESSRRIVNRKRLLFGDHINIFGLHLIFLGDKLALGANYGKLAVQEGALEEWRQQISNDIKNIAEPEEKKEYFSRSPRNLPHICTDTVEIEAPPQPTTSKKRPLYLVIGPSFTMAVPMLLGLGFTIYSSIASGRDSGVYMFTGILTAVSSALIAVMWALINLKYSQREQEENEQKRFNAYSNYLLGIVEMLKEKYDRNAGALNQMYPAANTYLSYNQYNSNLWNRNVKHADFQYYRLGIGDIPFQMKISVPKEKFTLINDSLLEKPKMILDEYKTLRNVPVGIDLTQKHLIGLVGGKEKKGAIEIMHVLAANIAACNSYTDVKMAFVYSAEDSFQAKQWECMKWFPHVWSQDHQMRYIASNEVEKGDVFFELTNIIRMRSQISEESRGKTEIKPYYVLFLSDPSLLEGELLSRYVLESEKSYGFTTLIMVEKVEQLPNACEEVIQNDSHFKGHYNLMNMYTPKEKIIFDSVSAQGLENMGRHLSNILVNEEETTSEIPSELDFFELYGVHKLEEFHVLDRWRKNRTYNSMKALIGKKSGNADCFLDVHEKYHGPHGLVAGTTGSGKSETLQTYILSLSLNFSPDDISFFIIDFKGGGMADLFTDLPHMAGQISNLSGNQINRAMISIKSENLRRQRVFKEYGVNNINLYTRLYKNGEAKKAIPHLFIIIDEFAELNKAEPEFINQLISVAQVGRSLGVHLILATQKPSGVVNDNIKSNTKFKLCLRVQSKEDSREMLQKPDAAYITQAGRCYLQVGNDELYELFQSGWSGAVYNEEDDGNKITAAILTRTGRPAVIGNFHKQNHQIQRLLPGKVKEVTQLEAVVAYLKKLSEENGYNQKMRLWQPVLKEQIYLSEISGKSSASFQVQETWPEQAGKWQLNAYVGLYDDPANQAQNPYEISFSEGGHVAVCGMVASGKSTFLQTVLYSLIDRYSPDTVNIYCLDFSSKMMEPFEYAPHVGGVICEDNIEQVGKLICMLISMLEQRKRVLGGGNYSQYVQAYGVRMPAIIVVVDNYGNFTEKTKNMYDSEMLKLAKEGVGQGIFLMLSGSGISYTEIPKQIAETIRNMISLEMGDRFKYQEYMHTTNLSVFPESGIKGRGLAAVDESILEFQTALCLQAKDDFERSEKIKKICKEMNQVWTGKKAAKIPSIPEKPVYYEFAELEQYKSAIQSVALLPLGYRKDNASVYSIPLDITYCYIVSGKAHTGRTNVLKLFLYAAMDKKADIAVIEAKNEKLYEAACENHLTYIQNSKELFGFFKSIVPEFQSRNQFKHQLEKKGLNEEEIFEKMAQRRPVFIIIANLIEFFDMIYKPQTGVGEIKGFVETILEKGKLHNIFFVAGLNQDNASTVAGYRGYQLFIGAKRGIHLGGNYSAQRLFEFQNIPYQQRSKIVKKGIGAATDTADETKAIEVVLPLAKKQQ